MDPLVTIGILILLIVGLLGLSRKVRNEGFNDIVTPAVQNAFGQEHSDYIRQSAEKYNPLMNLMNAQNNPLLSEDYSIDDANAAADSVAKALVSPGAHADVPSFKMNKANMKDILINRNSEGSARKAINNAESYKSVNCAAFDNKDFARVGGMCHQGGVDSGGNRMIGGLYVSEDDKETAQIVAKRMNSKEVNYIPTVGKCDPYKFSTTKQQCNDIINEMNCVKQGSFDAKGCGLCYQDDIFHYIDKDAIYHPPLFQVIGSGTLTVISSSSPTVRLTLSSTPQAVEVPSLKEGDVVQFNVTPATATLSGYLIGQTTGGDFRMDLVRMVQSDTITGANPRLSGLAQMNGENYTVMRPGRGKDSMNLSVLNTFSFLDPSEYPAQQCGSAPYIKNSASLVKLNSSPCYKKGQVPGAYSLECLQQTFQNAGCTAEGTGYPSDAAKAQQLMTGTNGSALAIGNIAAQVYAKSILAYTGKDLNGNTLSIQDWNSNTTFCTGKTITSPCDTMDPGDPISTDCLNYLWQNAGINTKSVGTTFTSGTMVASLNDKNENRFCTTKGTMAPINSSGNQNQEAIAAAREQGSVSAIKALYDSIHKTANDNSLRTNQRKTAVQQCYGIVLKNSPIINTGMVVWLDASDSSSIVLSGSSVVTWKDKSGKGNHATGVNGPTLNSGKIVLNGDRQYFTTNYTAKAPAESVFIVFSSNNHLQSSLVESSRPGGRQFQNDGHQGIGLGPGLASMGVRWIAMGTMTTTVSQISLGELLYNSSGVNIYLNGNLSKSVSENPAFTDGLTVIGGSPGQSGYYLNGMICEVIIYDRIITNQERHAIEGRLAWKWGFQRQLPTNHPFYRKAP